MAETRTSNTSAAAGNGEYYTLEELAEFFRFKKGRDSPSEARNALLVIVALITTATYQAALSPPGGLWQETKQAEFRVEGHEAGKTILGTNSFNYAFGAFIIANAVGFFGSIFMIDVLTEGFPMRLELGCTILALIASYDFAMISIIPEGRFSIAFILCSIILPLAIVFAAKKVRKARALRRQGHDIC